MSVPSVEAATCNVTDKGISGSPYGGTWGLHPELQKKADELLKKSDEAGLNVNITEGFRSKAYQNSLYAKGRSCGGSVVTNVSGGESYHNYGLAFDVFVGGWDESYDGNGNGKSDWQEVGAIGKSLGLGWGGYWTSFVDLPHFEYTYGLTTEALAKGEKPPEGKEIPSGDKDDAKETDSEKLNGSNFQGDIVDISAYFTEMDIAINNIGVDDRKVEVSNENRYGMFVFGGKVGNFLFGVAQVMSVVLIGYISLLWLVWSLSFAGIEIGQLTLAKLTFGKIDIMAEDGMKLLAKWSIFGLFVVVIVISGLIPQLFALIYFGISEFWQFMGRFQFT